MDDFILRAVAGKNLTKLFLGALTTVAIVVGTTAWTVSAWAKDVTVKQQLQDSSVAQVRRDMADLKILVAQLTVQNQKLIKSLDSFVVVMTDRRR